MLALMKTRMLIISCLAVSGGAAAVLATCMFRGADDRQSLAWAFAAALYLTAYFAYRTFGLRAIVPMAAALGLVYAFAMPYFSPIDEGNHFGVARFIATQHTLPLVGDYTPNDVLAVADHVYPKPPDKDAPERGLAGKMYEAQHPPLYYLVAAILSALVPGGLIVKLYALRAFGALCLAATAAILVRTYHLAVERELIPRSDTAFYASMAAVLLAPGPMLRMVTVSNLNLGVPLAAALIYVLAKSVLGKERAEAKDVRWLGVLAGAAALTHALLGVFAPIAAAIIWLRTRSIRRVGSFLLPFALIMGLWIACNLLNYGEPTAYTKVRPLIEPVINPQGESHGLSYIIQLLPIFVKTLWLPEDGGDTQAWALTLASGLSCLALFGIFIAALRVIMYGDSKTRRGRQFFQICIAALALNLLVVVYESGWTWYGSFLGRYLYPTLPCAVFAFYAAGGHSRVGRILVAAVAGGSLVLYATVLANIIGFGGRYPM